MNDHELTVLVEAAASGAINSQAAHHGGDTWDQLHASIKNGIRESALPFIYHGTKALAELGYTKPRTITTAEELDALPNGTVVLSESYHSDVDGTAIAFQRWYDGEWHRGARSGSTHPDNFLPVTILHEPQP